MPYFLKKFLSYQANFNLKRKEVRAMSYSDNKKKSLNGPKTQYTGPYLRTDPPGQEFYVEIGDQRRKSKGPKLAEAAR
jgi:hypothetical protein